MILEVLSAFIAAFAFGIVFNIKGKNLIFAAICGALGWFVYKLALSFGYSDITSLFFYYYFYLLLPKNNAAKTPGPACAPTTFPT